MSIPLIIYNQLYYKKKNINQEKINFRENLLSPDSDECEKKQNKDKTCFCCGSKCKFYNTKLNNDKLILKTCYLCHIILNFSKYQMGKIFIIHTEKSQEEINKFINENFQKNNKIPTPKTFDEKCKFVKLSVFNYSLNPQNYDKNFKLYATDEIGYYLKMNTIQTLFGQNNEEEIHTRQIKKYDTNFFDIETYSEKLKI